MTPRHFDADGNRIAMWEWVALFEARTADMSPESWWRRHTQVADDVGISTVWIGLPLSPGADQPHIWETLIEGGEHDGEMWRYATRAQAFDHHEELVRAMRAGIDPQTTVMPS